MRTRGSTGITYVREQRLCGRHLEVASDFITRERPAQCQTHNHRRGKLREWRKCHLQGRPGSLTFLEDFHLLSSLCTPHLLPDESWDEMGRDLFLALRLRHLSSAWPTARISVRVRTEDERQAMSRPQDRQAALI